MLDTKLGRITPADLPTPPEVALRVMHACADPNMSSRQLAAIISSDTALVAELLRMANSPFFGIGREIATPSQALVVLGTRALRNFVLGFSARESFRVYKLPDFDALSYWETALRRAVGARLLAETLGADADHAFTIGILQDFGCSRCSSPFRTNRNPGSRCACSIQKQDMAAMRDVLQKNSADYVAHYRRLGQRLYCSKRAGRNCISWSEPREHAAATDPHADAGRDKV